MRIHRSLLLLAPVFALPACVVALAAESPVDRWARAAGGREKVAAVTSLYREATIQVGGFTGTIKAWRTPDGKYRKEEQIAAYATVETFDGTTATRRQGAGAPVTLAGSDLARARGTAFANASAMFLAFFPERGRGRVSVETDDTLLLQPAGGIDWRVTLDRQTWLPTTMTHKEGDRTIVVTFVSYETIDGITLEKEIRRTTGDPRFDAVIQFTKTLINAPIDPALFSTRSAVPAIIWQTPSRYV